MKKAMLHTKVSVKLRKSELRNEWYLYLEAYPVFKPGHDKPCREREYLNRIITTPMWDKSRPARLNDYGVQTYKPKRDMNGIIICRSKADRETCIFADNVRILRQREYDNTELYSDTEQAMVEKKARGQEDFIEYFGKQAAKRYKNDTKSVGVNWDRAHDLLKIFNKNKPLPFAQIDMHLIGSFRDFLLKAPRGGNKSGTISQNTASTYFTLFKAALHQAFIDSYFDVDIAAKVKGISGVESRREYLTIEELNKLAATPCEYPMLKKAAFFSALTGLRHSDIRKMTWKELSVEGDHYRINFTQRKTGGVEYMPISEQAYLICGEPAEPDRLVFEGLQDPSWINRPVKKWIEAAGIKKHITFHCFRHSYATNQLTEGTDLYTVSKMLGHTNIRTTQIYAKVVDSKKEEAAQAIKLDLESDVI
ncbi:MAG: site-specific integrase [Bacteroidaceae bacterium]|nr:site-specific integrase [Bacteroidaceae bacterium]